MKFAFPDEQTFTVQNKQNTGEEKKSMENKYRNEYIGDIDSLRKFSNLTMLYVSWEGTYNYSWITKTPQLILEKVLEEGKYNVYLVKLNTENMEELP